MYYDSSVKEIKLNESKECDCENISGFDHMELSWFDTVMMALLIPLKTRLLTLTALTKNFNVPEEFLLPCDYSAKNVYNHIISNSSDLDIETPATINEFLNDLFLFFPNCCDQTNLEEDDIKKVSCCCIFFDASFDKPIPRRINVSPFTTPIFCFLKIEDELTDFDLYETYNDFSLTTIIHEHFFPDGKKQNLAYLKCKDRWYLYDNERHLQNEPLMPLQTEVINNVIKFNNYVFKPQRYSFYIYVSNILVPSHNK